MYPDILLITEASVGISCKTLASITRYAPDCACLIRPNNGLDRKTTYLQNERMAVLAQSRSEYVLIMDDDDELVLRVPKCEKIGYDALFFDYTIDGISKVDFRVCQPSRICVFCGVIVQRQLAFNALRYTIRNKFLREDIGFFYYVLKNSGSVGHTDSVLINKIGQRDPSRIRWLKRAFRLELDTVWRHKIAGIRVKKKLYDAGHF